MSDSTRHIYRLAKVCRRLDRDAVAIQRQADYAQKAEGRPWPPAPAPADKLADWACRCQALAVEIRAAIPADMDTHASRPEDINDDELPY